MRANFDIALLFGLPGMLILISLLTQVGIVSAGHVTSAISGSLLLGMGYMLVRLVHDFTNIPAWILRVSELVLAALVVGAFTLDSSTGLLILAEVIYLLVLLLFVSLAFIVASRRAGGVTGRRMAAIAVGNISLFVLFLIISLSVIIPDLGKDLQAITELIGLASAVAYFLGFATPAVVKRAWQEPELRLFLQRAATLPRLPETKSIIAEIQYGAAESVGAPNASVGLWDEASNQLIYQDPQGQKLEIPVDPESATGSAFVSQTPVYIREIKPSHHSYERATSVNIATILAAPITAGQKRLGILAVYADRPSIFADEDLELVKLLANQAAVVLENRILIDEGVRMRVQEQSTRLKEDFLSAAAHDLRTPLTILVGQVELMERRALRSPDAPLDIVSVQRLKKESYRLKTLVLELLDAERVEQGKLMSVRSEVDLVEVAQEACERHTGEHHLCSVQAEGAVIGMYDPVRMQQLVENLVQNAVKYSPDGGTIEIKLWSEHKENANGPRNEGGQSWNHLTVTDHGIGIPTEDLLSVFERFHRGTNVDDRKFVGMGLGLYICKTIVEQHGGVISVESKRRNNTSNGRSESTGNGSSDTESTGVETIFHVILPGIPVPALSGESVTASRQA
ncbi:MAG TPA: ATP-binding protein [Chloroflexia bacterium]|nr:ATP-binding protein [Chloroflexia bacterium]